MTFDRRKNIVFLYYLIQEASPNEIQKPKIKKSRTSDNSLGPLKKKSKNSQGRLKEKLMYLSTISILVLIKSLCVKKP